MKYLIKIVDDIFKELKMKLYEGWYELKRFLKFLIISLIIVAGAFSVFEFSGKYRMNILKNNIGWSIAAKNCKDSIAFDKDKNGNTYIAYSNCIKELKADGREEILLQDKSLNIENLFYYEDNLYFISLEKLYVYDLKSNKLKEILDDIPYEGKYLDRNLIVKDSKLLLSIGTATNSGIADYDGTYDIKKIPYDSSPINITLNGFNYGKENTGAFMPYGNSSQEGTKIKAQSLANASIIEIDLKNSKTSLYACGIRNIRGWDLDSDNSLIAVIGGMENIGARPINRDFDYIYKLDKGKWYGWPDFSGGDPISSPRFKGENIVSPLISNPPNKVVPAPIYQYSKPGIIKYLSIDKDGSLLDKDTKVFYNSEENMIEAINQIGTKYKLLKLKDESKISGIKYLQGEIYILDSGIGCIYKLQSDESTLVFKLPKSVWIFILIFLFTIVCLAIFKINNKRKFANK